MSLFNRKPKWLYEALGVDDPEVPTRLRDMHVEPVLDVFQGGWGLLDWSVLSLTQPASQAGIKVDWSVATNDVGWIALQIGVAHTGGAAPALVTISGNNTKTSANVALGQASIAVGASAFIREMIGYHPAIWPPGFAPSVIFPATGVGESYDARIIAAPYRTGFKPL